MKNMTIKLGIVGSAFNLRKKEIEVAKKFGAMISKEKSLEPFVCFDPESLPIITGRQIIKNFKKVACFTINKRDANTAKRMGFNAINLNTNKLKRQLIFIRNIDALVVCGGGSGTLTEVAIAYQLNKPIFLLKEVKGTVSVFKNKFLDGRKRVKIKSVTIKTLGKCIKELDNKKQNIK